MSEICLKLKVLAKIHLIVFFDFIRGQKSQKYWGSIFLAPQPRSMTHSKWPTIEITCLAITWALA